MARRQLGNAPSHTADATTKGYVDSAITAATSGVATQSYVTSATSSMVTLSDSQTMTNKTLTTPTLTTPVINGYTEGVVAVGTVTSAATLSISAGTMLTATLTASTACTFTMPTAGAGKSFVLMLKQAASTGGGTATFTNVKWGTVGAPTITATAGKMDILSFFSDGTNWYGSVAAGYTP